MNTEPKTPEREEFEKHYIANRLLNGLNEGQAENSLRSSSGDHCWQIWQLAKKLPQLTEVSSKPGEDGHYWVMFVDQWRMCEVRGDQLFSNGCGYRLGDFPKSLFSGPMTGPPNISVSFSDEGENSSPDSSSEKQCE